MGSLTPEARVLDQKIWQLADHYGISLQWRSEGRSYSFDGRSIALLNKDGGLRDVENIVHDIAHYIMASPSRRKYPEFGLGDSPDYGTKECARRVSLKFAVVEEELASLLGIFFQWAYDLGDWYDTMLNHSWLEGFDGSSYVEDSHVVDSEDTMYGSRVFEDYMSGRIYSNDSIHQKLNKLHIKGLLRTDLIEV